MSVARINTGSIMIHAPAWMPNFETSLTLWQRADLGCTNDSAVLCVDGDKIARWQDQGALNLNATNNVANPIWKANVKNGLGVARFYDTNYLVVNGMLGKIAGDDLPFMFAMAFSLDVTEADDAFLEVYSPVGNTRYVRISKPSSDTYSLTYKDDTTTASATGGTSDTNWHVLVVKCNGSLATLYVDGIMVGTENQNINVAEIAGTTTFYLGRTEGGMYLQGDIGEWMVFSGIDSINVNVTNIYTYLSRWTAAPSGVWTPTNETSLVVWQKADGGVTNTSGVLASNGDQVAGWKDFSTHGNYSTNWAAAGEFHGYPYYLTGIQNGLPVVRFYNTNYLEASGIVSYLKGSDIPMTYAVAYKNAESGVQGAFLFEQRLRSGAGDYILAYISGAGVTAYSRYDGTVEKSAVFTNDDGAWRTFIAVFNGSTATLYTNGVIAGTADQDVNVGDIYGDTDTLFTIGSGDTISLNGDIGEWMIFTNSSVSVANIHGYLNRWR